ncbi:hypothetical protein GCM10028816_12310 [Spirosoma lituiforme]
MAYNCRACVEGRPVLCIEGSSKINLFDHRNRLKKNDSIGLTNDISQGLGFFIYPSLVIDDETFIPYGFSNVKVWNRAHQFIPKDKFHKKNLLPIEQKESYKWI